jgi:hypothetical protein
MLKDHSTSFLRCQLIDTLISSTTETWSSRLKMEEIPKHGTSIKSHGPLRPSSTTNHGTSKAQEEPTTCRFGAPTQDGSNSSSMKVNNSSIGKMEELLMFQVAKTRKEDQLSPIRDTLEPTKNGRLSILTNQRKNKHQD